MAKTGITEEQLSQSLQQVGGLGALKEGGGARRESPFGSGYVRTHKEPAVALPSTPTALSISPPVSTTEEPRPDRRPPESTGKAPAPTRRIPSERERAALEEAGMEKVTVLMSPAMRDAVNLLARRFQRRRTRKENRITANTVFRAAIQLLLDGFPLEAADGANSEEELLALLKARFGRGP